MGAWGVHFDQCDGSLDFLGDVRDSREWSDVDAQLRDYVVNGGYDDADEAIASAELVAAALHSPSPRLEPDLASWAVEHRAAAALLRPTAIEALTLVLDNSELSELWADADENADWRATVEELAARLQAANVTVEQGQ